MKQTELKNKTILVTGVAGFIGSNLAKRLLNENKQIKVVGRFRKESGEDRFSC